MTDNRNAPGDECDPVCRRYGSGGAGEVGSGPPRPASGMRPVSAFGFGTREEQLKEHERLLDLLMATMENRKKPVSPKEWEGIKRAVRKCLTDGSPGMMSALEKFIESLSTE